MNQSMNTPPSQQQGVALITVLLVVTIIVVISTDMALRLQMEIKRAANLTSSEQSMWYALSAEAYASLILKESLDDDNGVVNLDQAWAVKNQVFPVDEGMIGGDFEDLHACFNLNSAYTIKESESETGQGNNPNSRAPAGQQGSQQNTQNNNQNSNQNNNNLTANADLLKVTPAEQIMSLLEAADVENFEAEKLRDGLIDWLDPDSVARTYGAEDYVYEGRERPMLPANSPMVDDSELRMIEGVTPQVMRKLDKLICVIPGYSEMVLNVNTVSTEQSKVLYAMFGGKLSQEDASSIISDRPDEGWDDVNDFFQLSEIQALGQLSDELQKQFTVEGLHFRLKTVTEFNESWFHMKTTFEVDDKRNLKVMARKIGV